MPSHRHATQGTRATRKAGTPGDAAAVCEPTELGRAVARAILATFSEAVGREVTAREVQEAHRALRERTGEVAMTDPERLLFLLDWLRKTR